ncbi:hypothetical protein KI688_004867 [Linnemannia hyalina]|uniref:Uncharacterized protein n=1 Tax=Linnemannia hyalina TaxID=64524 RepID=A0A9P8BPK7_9FUNG|nr:hypothetical protein KI688_004867 [Linnemannia hyalina]
MTSRIPAMPGAMYEANDHFERAEFQRLDDDHMPALMHELTMEHELTTEDEPKSLFMDASSCADLLVAVAHAVNAEVPRTTSTTMSSRSHPKLRQIMPAVAVHGPWYQFLAMRISDGITGDHCSHVVMACKSALNGNTLGRYINTVLIQAAAQLGGETGNHAGGWGAARVLATVTLLWDELWAALAAEGESSVPMANCAAYALASDYAENVHCTVEEDGEMRFIMYEDSTVLHDVTIRMEFFRQGGQPQWSMAIINMWRDYTMRRWKVDKDMCFDRYVRAYLKDDSGINMSKSSCNLAGVGWEDVRNWNNKNKGARAGTAQILTKRQM